MKQTLEKTFDIPFVVENGTDPYPWVRATPWGEAGQMFSVRVTNRSDVRLVIEFEPQAFSAALIASMGRNIKGKHDAFCDSVRLLMARGGEVSMSINGVPVSPSDSSAWPSGEWKKVSFQVVVILPEDVAGNPNLVQEKVREWGCLVMGTFLTLVRIDLIEHDGLQTNSGSLVPQTEGDRFSVAMNKYERSAINRFLCIAKYGTTCSVCGFNFRKKYGQLGEGFIHVHHVIPVSKLGAGYVVDPEKDLTPVCPNCHAMLHQKDPPYLPEELRLMIERERHVFDYSMQRSTYRMAAETPHETYGGDK